MPDGKFKPKCYSNQKFNMITAISRTNKQSSDFSYIWVCMCDCGKKFELRAGALRRKYSCGCVQKPNAGREQPKDYSSYQSHMVRVVKQTNKRTPGGYVIWVLKCDCGTIFERPAYALARKTVHSCGCKLINHRGRPKLPNNQRHVNTLYKSYANAAEQRNLNFKITMSEARALFESNCHYCNEPPAVWGKHARDYPHNGIDRMNNKIGYIKSNVVACCKTCNFAKGTMGKDEFKEWVSRVSAHMLA